jgi:hypothetical protein
MLNFVSYHLSESYRVNHIPLAFPPLSPLDQPTPLSLRLCQLALTFSYCAWPMLVPGKIWQRCPQVQTRLIAPGWETTWLSASGNKHHRPAIKSPLLPYGLHQWFLVPGRYRCRGECTAHLPLSYYLSLSRSTTAGSQTVSNCDTWHLLPCPQPGAETTLQ